MIAGYNFIPLSNTCPLNRACPRQNVVFNMERKFFKLLLSELSNSYFTGQIQAGVKSTITIRTRQLKIC